MTCDGSLIVTPANTGANVGTGSRAAWQAYGSTLVFPCAPGFSTCVNDRSSSTTGHDGASAANLVCQGSCIGTDEQGRTCPPDYDALRPCPPGCTVIPPPTDEVVYTCSAEIGASASDPCVIRGKFKFAVTDACTAVMCDGRDIAIPANTKAANTETATQASSQMAYGSTLAFICSQGFSGAVTYTCGSFGGAGRFTSSGACTAVTEDGAGDTHLLTHTA